MAKRKKDAKAAIAFVQEIERSGTVLKHEFTRSDLLALANAQRSRFGMPLIDDLPNDDQVANDQPTSPESP